MGQDESSEQRLEDRKQGQEPPLLQCDQSRRL